MLRVLTLSTLFPDSTRANFGVFVERQTLALAALASVAVTVVAPVGIPPAPFSRMARYRPLATLPRRETWKGLDVHRPRFLSLPGTDGRFHPRTLSTTLVPLLDTLAGSFDVIDASFFFPDGPAAVALGKRYGVPVSIKARGADIHHSGRVSASRAQVLEAGRGADGLLAVSHAMKADMVALGMPAERITVHLTGIDRARFAPVDRAPAKAALGIAGPLVVSVGALIPRKGHAIVVKAVARLPGVSLLIAGAGPEHAALQALIATLRVGDRVRLLGALPHADLPALIAAADVMALASESEGLANAWVESLACGTPILVSDAGGAREVVTSPVAGRIVARDASAYAAAIATMIAHPPAQESIRAMAAQFSWEANGATLRDHLAALVARRAGAAQASSG